MNKKLIALAIAGAFAAPAAFADSGNVTIYGNVIVEADSFNNGSATATGTDSANASRTKGRINSSQNTELGFKGNEDLGNGLKGVFQVAVDVRLDGTDAPTTGVATAHTASNSNFASRNSYVGLEGGFGKVLLGKHDTPYKMSTGSLDVFTGTVADYNSLFGTAGYGTGATTYAGNTAVATAGTSFQQLDHRPGNTVIYFSPDMSGFSAAASYTMTDEALVSSTATATSPSPEKGLFYSLSGTYSNGPLFVTVGRESQKMGLSNVQSAATKGYTGTGTGAGGAPVTVVGTKIGAAYTFGDTKVGAIWERVSDDAVGLATDATSMAGFTDAAKRGHTAWNLGVAHKLGAITLKAAYSRMGALEDVEKSGAKQWTLGADYAFSKRTSVYALYTKLNNEDNAAYAAGQGGTAGATNVATTNAAGTAAGTAAGGADPRSLAVGIRHSF